MSKYHNPDKVYYINAGSKTLKVGGYRRSQVQPEDKIRKGSKSTTTKLPPKVDLRPYMTKVEQQGQVGSCTANAMAGAYEYLAKRHLGDAGDVSRLFIYYNARKKDGWHQEDTGTSLRNCIEVLRKVGACSEATWPYQEQAVHDEPHEHAYDEAKNFLVEDCERIDNDLIAWKSCLAEGYPIAFGVELFSSFDNVKRDGRVKMPNPKKEEHTGGHAMLCVGYSDADKVFIVRNSWGPEWGDKGYCYIPYDYVLNSDYNDADSWAIKNVTDLDFSKGVVSEEEESMFYDEGTLIFYDFYIICSKPKAFTTALEKLCKKHAIEGNYNFNAVEDQEIESTTWLEDFHIMTEDPEAFAQLVSDLAEEHADESECWDYTYSVEEGYTGYLTMKDFYIRTQKADAFQDKVIEHCEKYATDGDYYFEGRYDEDDEEILYLDSFYIATEDEETFIQKLYKLCEKYAVDNDFDYSCETTAGGGEETETEETETEEEMEEQEYLSINEFYITTKKGDAFVEKVIALCDKYAIDGDYDFTSSFDESSDELLYLEEFYIAVEDQEDFIEKFDALCAKYATDEDYSYSYGDNVEEEDGYVYVNGFYIRTQKAEAFEEKVIALCEKYATDEDYGFESSYDEDDEEILYLEGFYIATESQDEFGEKLDALCAKFAVEEDYGFEIGDAEAEGC